MKLAALLLGCVLATGVSAQGVPDALTRPLQAAGVDLAHVAVVVADAQSGATQWQHNAQLPMNPASVMKLVTTYAGLALLGPSHTWKTSVLSEATVDARGVLKGNVYLRGSGDPKLTQERLWLLLKALRARGVRTIAGDVVLDRGRFDVAGLDPGQFDQQPLRAYNVTPDALLLHWKALELRFVPQPEGVKIFSEPALNGVQVVSRLRAVAGNCDNWRQGLRYAVEESGAGVRLQFDGSYPAECGEKSWSLGVLDHPRFAKALLEQLWAAVGGKLGGRVREGTAPEAARVWLETESPPLAEIVRDINKWSNNVMARQLLLSLGASGQSGPVREEHGARAVRAWLTEQGLALPELRLENGSGLSRVERISAGGLAQLLVAAAASPVMPEYLASLPIGGVDGTMQKRLQQEAVSGRARIKTGTLDGVRAAAGFVQDRNGRLQVVVMLVNDANANNREVREAEDALIRWVYDARP